jgi:type 1 glutamine amidotransferase
MRLAIVFTLLAAAALHAQNIRAKVVTGGHNHDPEFYSVFIADTRFTADIEPHPKAYTGRQDRHDVLVLYDMILSADEPTRQYLRKWVEAGKGLVILHHALCSFGDWPWWTNEVMGAKYLFEPFQGKPPSTYHHDQQIPVAIIKQHFVTDGVPEFTIHDETYKGMWFAPNLEVLATTTHPLGDGPVAWIGPSKYNRVAVIQLGHDRQANRNPYWQRLVRNAIVWAGYSKPPAPSVPKPENK